MRANPPGWAWVPDGPVQDARPFRGLLPVSKASAVFVPCRVRAVEKGPGPVPGPPLTWEPPGPGHRYGLKKRLPKVALPDFPLQRIGLGARPRYPSQRACLQLSVIPLNQLLPGP